MTATPWSVLFPQVADDELRATCWCESRMVGIPRDWVGVRTKSCGKPECHAPSERKAA